jgi:hypothetical protein
VSYVVPRFHFALFEFFSASRRLALVGQRRVIWYPKSHLQFIWVVVLALERQTSGWVVLGYSGLRYVRLCVLFMMCME